MRGERADEGRRHLAQLNPLLFASGEKVLHGTAIGTAVMGVGEAGREELGGGESPMELAYRAITTFIVP